MKAWLAAVVVGTTLICATGCTGPVFGVGGSVQNCGTENYGRGDGYDATMRDCLWQGYTEKQRVAFTTSVFTNEGDPIYTTVKVVAPDRIMVRVDTTHDQNGPRKVRNYTCTTLERRTVNWGGHERVTFMAGNCTGGETAQVGF